MSNKFIIGVDPGRDGAVVCMFPDGTLEYNKIPLIGTEVDLQELKRIFAKYSNNGDSLYGLEDVKPFPGIAAMAMSKLMELKGIKQGLLVGLDVPYVLVAPKLWQKTTWGGVPPQKKSNGKNDTKATSLLAARRLFPKESFLATDRSKVPHDGIVDAALICWHLKAAYSR